MKNRKTADQPESACASNNLVEMKFSRQPLIDDKPAPTIFTDCHGRRNIMRIAAVLANGLSIEASALFLVDEEGLEALNGLRWSELHRGADGGHCSLSGGYSHVVHEDVPTVVDNVS